MHDALPSTCAAIDCHVHVFDPRRFAYAADAWYVPTPAETGTPAQLDHVLQAHGVRHALLVGPNSGYGLDNRCLLDTIARGQGRYKGIAVVPNGASLGQLQDLQAAGVVGIAFNVALLGVDFYRGTGPLLQRLRELGLVANVQVEGDQLTALTGLLADSGAQLVFDHCGRPVPAGGVGQAGFAALLALAQTGRAAVKLSGHAKISALPFPHTDLDPFVWALVEAFTPHHLVWASDWPFLRAPSRIDYGPLRALLVQHLPDAADRQAVEWETPRRLFGFDAAG
ncbi:amidohydrolase [Pseudorhodoferax sp. Leaf267]|uniref:amidohydrolase family protein n=1 Tax=Pseudorhodoferax sp. Leaf267 TaxID=1736316 RepID=UPI0006FA3ABC|nr:amidohydrolase family protein [Pseudorhodoferax sp. Leaf267]KQP23071.1 2-pyrone-4,6-dicarboxylate hydrolase [Pseudorhodoferax sp. Leaf267]